MIEDWGSSIDATRTQRFIVASKPPRDHPQSSIANHQSVNLQSAVFNLQCAIVTALLDLHAAVPTDAGTPSPRGGWPRGRVRRAAGGPRSSAGSRPRRAVLGREDDRQGSPLDPAARRVPCRRPARPSRLRDALASGDRRSALEPRRVAEWTSGRQRPCRRPSAPAARARRRTSCRRVGPRNVTAAVRLGRTRNGPGTPARTVPGRPRGPAPSSALARHRCGAGRLVRDPHRGLPRTRACAARAAYVRAGRRPCGTGRCRHVSRAARGSCRAGRSRFAGRCRRHGSARRHGAPRNRRRQARGCPPRTRRACAHRGRIGPPCGRSRGRR